MKANLPARNFSSAELIHWKQAIFDIYARMRLKAKTSYEVEYGGIILTVFPNVYAPEFFNDSLWYAQQLKEIVGNKSLLEIGTGTGVIAILCALAGAKVVATDINPDAVKNTTLNVKRHTVNVSVRGGDLYEQIKAEEKFDFIFWAHPFNNWELPDEDMLLRSGIDPAYKSLRGYISQAKKHLAPRGRLLLGTGDSADLRMIDTIAKENGYTLKLLKEIEQPLELGKDARINDIIYEFEK